MSVWYNEAENGSKFAKMAVTSWESISTKVDFTEVGIVQDDGFYYLYGHAVSCTDIVKVGAAKDWKFEPQLLTFQIAKKDYEKTNYKTKAKEQIKQTSIEKVVCLAIAELDLEKVYSAKFSLQNSPQNEMILTGESDGEKLPEKMVKSWIKLIADFKEVAEPQIIKISELEAPKGRSGSYPKAQSEYEKCNDRLRFMCEQYALVFPGTELKTVGDLAGIATNPDEETKFFNLLPIIAVLSGSGY